MKIFTGNANPDLAKGIARHLGMTLGHLAINRFPDGEIGVKIDDNIRGKDVFIIQPTCYPPNEHVMELLIVIDAMRRASAARITAVMPFYGYARQDRKDQPRVPITAKLVANLLVAAGTNRLLAMDFHAQQIQGFFDIPVDHLYAAPLLVRHLREKLPAQNRMVVAPDPGGLKMAYSYSQLLDAGLSLAGKHRTSATEVEAFRLVGDVVGKDCVLVDDMTTTAGTLCAAARLVREQGARSVRAAVTHCPITPLGVQRLKDSGLEELVTTDSIQPQDWGEFPITTLTVADLLGDAIKRIYGDESVSRLFEIHQGRTQ